jgi:hypothetical protein
MHPRRLAILLTALAIGALSLAPVALARTLVDPTTLTPPLKPTRICYQQGPWVQCATPSVTTLENEEAGELSCGTVYVTMTETIDATRWYLDGLLVERNAVDKMRGSWSLSADGSAPTVEIAADLSWHEEFVVPGDVSSSVERSHGTFIRVVGLGAIGMDAGTFKPDGTFRGHAGEDVPEEDAALCALLVG